MVPTATAKPCWPVITVDGPSGVGKGMVTRWLAQRTGFLRLDSGALYRILALAAQARGVALTDFVRVAGLAPQIDIRFVGDSEANEQILVDGQDWTRQVRLETTGALASQIAAAPEVRAALLQRQHDFRVAPGLIADGRDMGTVVFPDATVKLFLDASPQERAERRLKQLNQAGVAGILANLVAEISERDFRDRNRSVAPLCPAVDAHFVETTGLNPQQVLAQVRAVVEQAGL